MRSIGRESGERSRPSLSRILFAATISVGIVLYPIRASAESSREIPVNVGSGWEVVLKKGERAPFYGVLVPEYLYRQYSLDSELFPECDKRLNDIMATCYAEQKKGDGQSVFLLILAGFALGYVSNDVLR